MLIMTFSFRNSLGRLTSELTGFSILGVISVLLNLTLTVLFHEILGLSARVAYGIGLISAIILNFIVCRKFIFKSNKNITIQFPIFTLSSFLFRGLEYITFLLQEALIDIPYPIAIITIHSVSFLIKFIYYRKIVFA